MRDLKVIYVSACLMTIVGCSNEALRESPVREPAALANAPTAGPVKKSVDVSSVVESLGAYTYTLDSTVYLWNWAKFGPSDSSWRNGTSSSAPAGFEQLKAKSQLYWQGFCSRNPQNQNPPECGLDDVKYGKQNVYGPGLYLAVDPVATRSYGGYDDDWQLLQVRLKKGTRFLIIGAGSSTPLSSAAKATLLQLGCRNLTTVAALMSLTNDSADPGHSLVCLNTVRSILKDQLHIQAFFYQYNPSMGVPSIAFRACAPSINGDKIPPAGETNLLATDPHDNPLREGAFVLTDVVSINPQATIVADDVRVYSSKTTDDSAQRNILQGLFYKASHDRQGDYASSFFNSVMQQQYPDQYLRAITLNSTPSASPNSQTFDFQICPVANSNDPKNTTGCSSVSNDLPSPVYPQVMNENTIPLALYPQENQLNPELLWMDPALNGQQTNPAVDNWITGNIFGCSDKPRYTLAPK